MYMEIFLSGQVRSTDRGNVSSLGSVFLSYLEKSIFVEENERMIFY